MQFIDTHCHIHDINFFPETREEVYARAIATGVSMIVVGTSQGDSRAAVAFSDSHDQVWSVVGVHPHDTKDGWAEIGSLLAARPTSLVGIGEIGLDYFYDNSPRKTQIRALEEQLQWAEDYNLPVSFHVREAYDDFWPIFDSFSGIRGILHSFTDTTQQMERALERGLYIGINGISTFTKSEDQRAMFDAVPLERMVLETDAPFLTPVPFRGKINEPALVRSVAEYHAELRRVSVEEIALATTANAKTLFYL